MIAIRVCSTSHFVTPTTRTFHARSYSDAAKPSDHRASSKLFADAAKEEVADEGRPTRLTQLENEHENWMGEERIQDAVLRMLVDKYKPLRSGVVRSAEEKIKLAPPKVTPAIAPSTSEGNHEVTNKQFWASDGARPQNMANVPLLPAIEGHQPWHTTFRAPSHATTSVKYGHIPPPSSRRAVPLSQMDEKALRKERETRKRTEMAGRLSGARESVMDYKLGLGGKTSGVQRRPNPVTMKGWASLVEDRIEKARLEGQFKTLKGRGQPLTHITEEKNPFVAREEFLMNRIVQRNGAAPPWVEIQGELESAVSAFREVVKQSWTRRALRMLTIAQPPALLPKLTLSDVTALRDTEWESREQAYHDSAIDELNSLVRKYNGLAPYAVRRPYYLRSTEIERAYRESGPDILRGIAERVNGPDPLVVRGNTESDGGSGGQGSGGGHDPGWVPLGLGDVLRRWLSKALGRPER
ncbi:hypothetical protein BXZ70DRAFT_896054 [Cristinia sonorae]|uniref:DnaJ homologue subfamily C member 28 conserved domain-containing protein n=1 Tax=Cristinia sonorae TaxID=1940300 RepID=A0A8K0ULE4_9AGAR|nr:hypothetical protein BXZ70DRAFT_896054 [Cristinia sonorae]